jgi:hypothetical protein
MERREQWRPVLDTEAERWKAKSYDQLANGLAEEQAYEVEYEGKAYQVEVELLEDTDQYLHFAISVDDGSIPASFRPLSASFIREKPISS